MIDARNTVIQHAIVAIFSLMLALIFNFYFEIGWSTVFARVSFVLLFIILIIGPITRLKKPTKVSSPLELPWTWRSELGIWFTITAIIHFYFVMSGRLQWNMLEALGGFIGGSGYGLANLLGLIALFWAIVLAASSSRKIIAYFGIESWKWLHSYTYVIFYLVATHLLYFQFFSTRASHDFFGYLMLTMVIVIIILQLIAFTKSVITHQKI